MKPGFGCIFTIISALILNPSPTGRRTFGLLLYISFCSCFRFKFIRYGDELVKNIKNLLSANQDISQHLTPCYNF